MTALVVWVMPSDELLGLLRRDHAECPYCVTAYHDDLSFEAADEIERLRAENRRLMDGMELAWGIICNGRAWDPAQHDEWEAAKVRFRDDHWHPALDRNVRLHTPEQENDR